MRFLDLFSNFETAFKLENDAGVYVWKFSEKCFCSYNLQLIIYLIPGLDAPCACVLVLGFLLLFFQLEFLRLKVMLFYFQITLLQYIHCVSVQLCFSTIKLWWFENDLRTCVPTYSPEGMILSLPHGTRDYLYAAWPWCTLKVFSASCNCLSCSQHFL